MRYEDKALNHVRGAGCVSEHTLFGLRVICGGMMIMLFMYVAAGKVANNGTLNYAAFTYIMIYTTTIYYLVAILAHALHIVYGPKPVRRNGKFIYPENVPFSCISKTV